MPETKDETNLQDGMLPSTRLQEFRVVLGKWWKQNARSFPWRKQMPLWKALLTEVMLQRTRAEQVINPFNIFDRKFRVAQQLSDFTESDAYIIFSSLGLRWRIPLFVRLAREISRCNGRLPRTEKDLRDLPGIGSYTAAAALSLYSNVRAVIVDANTVRIICRLLGKEAGPESRRQNWIMANLEYLTPEAEFREFNYSLIDLGALVCRPYRPLCVKCPLREFCVTGKAK